MTRIMGGPFGWPPIPFPVPDVSAAKRTGATFRMTRRHDALVARARVTQATIELGTIDKTAAGRKGTREYPYKQSHSTSCKASMAIQHVVVIHKMTGNTKEKLIRIEAACNKWLMS